MKIVLIGPQGSGKGTQGEFLSKFFKIPVISVGKLLRDEIRTGSEKGGLISHYIDRGYMLPTDMTIGLVKDRLSQKDCKRGFILDGYPRDEVQAKALDEYQDIDAVLLLDVPDKESIRRLSARTQCKKEHIYGLRHIPKKPGICDIDGLKLEKRKDDTPEGIKTRLKIYHKESDAILGHYRDRIIKVNGVGSPEHVFRLIKVAVGE